MVAVVSLLTGLGACSDDDKGATIHSGTQLLPALLTVDDLSFFPSEWQWEENMRKVIPNPTPPWENTLDPYLCPEAGTPAILTKEQAQLELTGGSVMEILVSADNAPDLYSELDAAYGKCPTGASTAYTSLADPPKVGDESASYRTERGVVTIARFGKDVMILKWWVGKYFDQVSSYYPNLVTTAADKVDTL